MSNILDLDPFAFAAALEELGLPPEEQTRLRQLYQQKASPLAGVKEAVAPEEGRNTSDYLPVSVPEGQSIAEGLSSGNWDWAVPEGFSEAVTTAAEGIEAPGQILSGVPFSEQEMQAAAFKTAGTAGVGSLAFDAPEGATRMFGSMRAKNYPWDRDAKLAKRIDDAALQGKDIDPDLAWEDFGIEFGDQGPVFQIDPKNAQVADPSYLKPSVERFFDSFPSEKEAVYDVKQILDFPELYDNYPKLGTFSIVFNRYLAPEQYGWMDVSNRKLVLNTRLLDDPEELRGTLLHEMQHGIQAIEGTSGGASMNYFIRQDDKTGKYSTPIKDLKPKVDRLNTVLEEVWDAEDNYGKESKTYKALAQEYVNVKSDIEDLVWKKYLTNEGEIEARAAQLWDQLSSEEKRTTKPSDIKREALGLLKKEYGDNYMPTARFAEGGMVQGTNMENDMNKLFAEGGLNTGDAQVDPVSGNEVPPGSMPEEVRDDVDAKLSGGEYVVPADVLRFYGVSFFEKLRKKAKEGLAEMDKEGRIGGDDKEEDAQEMPEEEEDDFPFSEDELMFEDEGEVEMAAGGVVPPGGIKTFNPNQYYAGFSVFGDVPPLPTGQAPGTPPAPTPATPPVEAGRPVAKPQPESWADKQLGGNSGGGSGQGGNPSTGRSWDPGVDFSNPAAVESYVTKELSQVGKFGQIGSGVGQLVAGPLGGLAGGLLASGTQLSNARAAAIVAREKGQTELADKLDKQIQDFVESKGIGARTVYDLLATGEGKAKRYMESQGSAQGPKPGATPVKGVTGSSQNSGGASGADKFKSSSSSGTGTKKGTVGSGSTSGTTKSTSSTNKPSSSTSKSGSSSSKSSGSHAGKAGFKSGGLVERRKK